MLRPMHLRRISLALVLTACGGGTTRPTATPTAPPADGVVTTPSTTAGTKPAGKPPVKGAFQLKTGSDGKNTVDFAALMERGGGTGEIVLGFDDEAMTVGVWVFRPKRDEKTPGKTLYNVCRGRMTLHPTWEGKTFTLGSDVEVAGWSDAVWVEKSRTAPDTTKRTDVTNTVQCSFSLAKGTYTVEGDDKTLKITKGGAEPGTFVLERTLPLEQVPLKSLIEARETAAK